MTDVCTLSFATPTRTLTANQNAYLARKFGVFLHFGVETFIDQDTAPPGTNINFFNPSLFDINQWFSQVIVPSKAKYATLVAKHHNGFCLWPSAATARNISNCSPWYNAHGHTDIVAAFVAACHANSIAPNLYFSVWDREFERVDSRANQTGYKALLQAQITELLTNYGQIASLWLDGTEWEFTDEGNTAYPWTSTTQRNTFIKGLQPNCLVIDNGHTFSFTDSDIMEYEGGSVGTETPGGNAVPAETCDTIRSDDNWFWRTTPSATLVASDIRDTVARMNSRDSNFLLNCGPDNRGLMPDDIIATMQAVGALLP